MKKTIFIIGMSLITFSLVSQNCAQTYKRYNQILIDYYVNKIKKPQFDLSSLNIKDCLGCGEVDKLYTIYNGEIPDEQLKDFFFIVEKNKCQKVEDDDFQSIISENPHLLEKSISDITSDYLLKYLQLIRSSGDIKLIQKSDTISHELLQKVIMNKNTTDIGWLLMPLLYGSDILSVDQFDSYESRIKDLVRQGNIYPGIGAYMLDRVYYTRNGKQKYGTLRIKSEFFPFENIEKIDSIRKDIYYYPLEVTIERYDVKRPEGYTFNNKE